jgi:hypothetical protein
VEWEGQEKAKVGVRGRVRVHSLNRRTFMKGYRTFIVAGLIAVSGVLAQTDWVAFLANPKAGLVAIVSGTLMAFMRSITNSGPGEVG